MAGNVGNISSAWFYANTILDYAKSTSGADKLFKLCAKTFEGIKVFAENYCSAETLAKAKKWQNGFGGAIGILSFIKCGSDVYKLVQDTCRLWNFYPAKKLYVRELILNGEITRESVYAVDTYDKLVDCGRDIFDLCQDVACVALCYYANSIFVVKEEINVLWKERKEAFKICSALVEGVQVLFWSSPRVNTRANQAQGIIHEIIDSNEQRRLIWIDTAKIVISVVAAILEIVNLTGLYLCPQIAFSFAVAGLCSTIFSQLYEKMTSVKLREAHVAEY